MRNGVAVSVGALARVDADIGGGGVRRQLERLVAFVDEQATVEAPLDRVRLHARPRAHVAVECERRSLEHTHALVEPPQAAHVQAHYWLVYWQLTNKNN